MKKRRTSVFFENEEFDQIKEIANQNEQTLAWVIRKIVSSFIKVKNEKQLPTSTPAEVNAAITDLGLAKLWEEFQSMTSNQQSEPRE